MKAFLTCMALALALHLSIASLAGQNIITRSSKDVAYDAWNKGNYETAYDHFNSLLLLYSRDPLYKYYTGACLVKMEHDLSRAVTLLGSAINSSANIKSVPADVWFYYGRALQMNGSYAQASDAFRTFAKNAGRKVALENNVQKYIDECNQGHGAWGKLTNEVSQSREAGGQGEESAGPKEVSVERRAESVEITTQGEVNEIPEEYDKKLAEALKLQYSADSLTRIAKGVRKEMETAAQARQVVLQKTAEELEGKATLIQTEADNLFITIEQPVKAFPEDKAVSLPKAPVQTYSQFKVLTEPAYSNTNPIPVDIKLPAGLIYTIQLAAFKKPVPPSLFKGLYPLYAKRKPENGLTFYYTGIFRTHEAARQALAKVRTEGLSDAFIIVLMDGTQVSLERAALLEKEWAVKPLSEVESYVQKKKEVPAADTLPVGTLTFRAEVMRSKKPVKPDAIEKIELLAGTRGLDMIKNNLDETVFLIGNFITFESADEYVSLLIRNGYSAARIAAYVGVQEIPVEAARELLNKLE